MAESYTIYFAGQLFDHKHLAGNALLASCIDSDSQGRYRCILPQNLEQRGIGPMGIRDQDLRTVMECDLALFNFDGSELPPGAVVEYMYAKMLDIPAVILRTDFRGGGDQDAEGDPWNLMASFYPRTRTLHLEACSGIRMRWRWAETQHRSPLAFSGGLQKRLLNCWTKFGALRPSSRASRQARRAHTAGRCGSRAAGLRSLSREMDPWMMPCIGLCPKNSRRDYCDKVKRHLQK